MDSQLPNNGTMNALFNKKTIKKIIAATLVGVILAAGISTTAFSFSWFSNRNNVTRNIEGKTQVLTSQEEGAHKMTLLLLIDQFTSITFLGYKMLAILTAKRHISSSKKISI